MPAIALHFLVPGLRAEARGRPSPADQLPGGQFHEIVYI